MWNAQIYSKHASVCCVNWIVLSVAGIYYKTEFFWKQVLDEVRVKIIVISPSRGWRFHTATSAIDQNIQNIVLINNLMTALSTWLKESLIPCLSVSVNLLQDDYIFFQCLTLGKCTIHAQSHLVWDAICLKNVLWFVSQKCWYIAV